MHGVRHGLLSADELLFIAWTILLVKRMPIIYFCNLDLVTEPIVLCY